MMQKAGSKKQNTLQGVLDVFDSSFFRALSEPVRVEIIKFLLVHGRADVATVASKIKKDRSVLSRHLHMLTEAGILKNEKISRNSYFEIDVNGFRSKAYALFSRIDKALHNCCS
jgi:DNA-binding transcriptional ArsR family regulator